MKSFKSLKKCLQVLNHAEAFKYLRDFILQISLKKSWWINNIIKGLIYFKKKY